MGGQSPKPSNGSAATTNGNVDKPGNFNINNLLYVIDSNNLPIENDKNIVLQNVKESDEGTNLFETSSKGKETSLL